MRRIIALLIAFLLTGTLVLFGVSLVCRQVIAPGMAKDGARVSDAVIRAEKELAAERVNRLAELYGFAPEPVSALVSEETLKELNAQASRWWSSVLRDGRPGQDVTWEVPELETLLVSDPGLTGLQEEENAENLVVRTAEDIRKSITRMVLPVRAQLVRLGLQKVENKVDIQSIVTFLLDLPWTALALCALLAGLIALLEGRGASFARLYIGSSLGGAAIVLVCLAVLALCAGVQPMIREASGGLAIQYADIMTRSLVRAGALAAAMTAGCVLCLRQRRKGKAA